MKMQRAVTHCKHGHRFDSANTRIGRNGERICKPCDARRQAAYKARRNKA